MHSLRVLVILLIIHFIASPNASAQPDPFKAKPPIFEQNDLARVAQLMSQTFSNKNQKSEGDVVGAGEQQLIGKRIWRKYEDQGTWVFIRWINTAAPDKPLTTVFLNFQMGWEDTLMMQIYPVPEEIYKDGSYQKPNSEAPYLDCSPDDLIEISNCGYRMVKRGSNHYEVFHNDNYCPFENGYSPMPYFDIQMNIKAEALYFNTAFFNFNQEKVFQYEDQVYLPVE